MQPNISVITEDIHLKLRVVVHCQKGNEVILQFLARLFSKKRSRHCHSPGGGVALAASCENFEIF